MSLSFFLLQSNVAAVELSIFSDINLRGAESDGNNGLSLGVIDFFAAHKFSESSFALIELVIEESEGEFVVDLERLWLGYTFSDRLRLAAGRFHAPLGYWNRNLHHGAILQDTVDRPFFLEFEDEETGILPVHSIGLMIKGLVLAEAENFHYEVLVSNGPSLSSRAGLDPVVRPALAPNSSFNQNKTKSIAFRVTYASELDTWHFGLFGMFHDLDETSNSGLIEIGNTLVQQRISGIDFRYVYATFDLQSEFFRINNKDKFLDGKKFDSLAFYIQTGWRISDQSKLVYRYSDLRFDKDDTYFRLLGAQEQSRHVLGLRFDYDSFNTVKFEWNHFSDTNNRINKNNSFTIQWSLLIP